ncbi:hypothetical protein VNO77_23652 [Canavalia gladiata]|uniref:Uncharacterized protein n=1 Tax=Canavalia gladiata TaxID=3824 RepID=A0AAN9LA14_CANGL
MEIPKSLEYRWLRTIKESHCHSGGLVCSFTNHVLTVCKGSIRCKAYEPIDLAICNHEEEVLNSPLALICRSQGHILIGKQTREGETNTWEFVWAQ